MADLMDMLSSLGRGIGNVASVPLTGLAMVEAARRGQSPGAVLTQQAQARQALANAEQEGLLKKAAALQDPAARAYLAQNPDAAEAFGLHSVPQGIASPEVLASGGYEPGGVSPPARLGVVPPMVETSGSLQRKQLEANINWLNQNRDMMRGMMAQEGVGGTPEEAGPQRGITAGANPALTPTAGPVGGGPGAPASPGAQPAPSSTAGPTLGGGHYMEMGPSGPSIKPRRLTVHNLPAGSPDPITGGPLTRARTIRGVTGDTVLVPTPSPGQLQQAQRTRSALDTISDLDKKMNDPRYAQAVEHFGPIDPINTLTGGMTGGWTAIPGSNPYWFNYRHQGGTALDPQTRELMESVGFLAGTGFQGLTAGIRHKDVLDDIRVHLPDPSADTPEQIRAKVTYLKSRYADILAAIPSSVAAGLGSNPDDMGVVTPKLQEAVAAAADQHVNTVGKEQIVGGPTPNGPADTFSRLRARHFGSGGAAQ
jgi:hypothetical protein